jgi:hypothetical protein
MDAKYKPVKILNAAGLKEKMEMDLYFLCDELFMIYHALKQKHKHKHKHNSNVVLTLSLQVFDQMQRPNYDNVCAI